MNRLTKHNHRSITGIWYTHCFSIIKGEKGVGAATFIRHVKTMLSSNIILESCGLKFVKAQNRAEITTGWNH